MTARVGRVERTLATAPPEALFLLSAISQYIGAAIAVSVFDEVEPQTVAWFRVMGASIAPDEPSKELLTAGAVCIFGVSCYLAGIFVGKSN